MINKEFILNIIKEIGLKKGYCLDYPEDWYKGIHQFEIQKMLSNRQFRKHFDSLNQAIVELFPNYNFLEWKFYQVRLNWWNNKENVIMYLKWFEKEMGWTKPEDWYNLTHTIILLKFGKMLTTKFKHVNDICYFFYPEFNFLPWKFIQTSNNWWSNKNNIITYLIWLEKEIGWTKPEDWYNLNADILRKNNGSWLLANYKIYEICNLIYPENKFDLLDYKNIPQNYWENFDNIKIILIRFYNENGRLPSRKECLSLNGINISTGIVRHGGLMEIAKNLNFPTKFGIKTLSGNIVQSSYEVIVDNFLFLNNIPYEYDKKIIDNKKFKFDFKINDFYIEVWGLNDKKQYLNVKKYKKTIYEDNNLKLISLESSLFINSLKHINDYLINLIKENNIKNNGFYEDNLDILRSYTYFHKELEYFNIIKNECIKQNFEIFPIQAWWCKNGFYKEIIFLLKNGKTMESLANELCLKNTIKLSLKDFNYIKKELLIICDNIGKFPTSQYLFANKKSFLVAAICKYHGGFSVVRKNLGY